MSAYPWVFEPNDLVLFVWPRQHETLRRAGGSLVSPQEAASEAWAMDAAKAERVRILVSVFEGTIVGAWAVSGVTNELRAPEGKTRRVNRASFETHDDPRLHYLTGRASQLGPRRNPQATIEIRDLDGSDMLLEDPVDVPAHGVARVGDYVLSVLEDGSATLTYPASAPVTLRPVA